MTIRRLNQQTCYRNISGMKFQCLPVRLQSESSGLVQLKMVENSYIK